MSGGLLPGPLLEDRAHRQHVVKLDDGCCGVNIRPYPSAATTKPLAGNSLATREGREPSEHDG